MIARSLVLVAALVAARPVVADECRWEGGGGTHDSSSSKSPQRVDVRRAPAECGAVCIGTVKCKGKKAQTVVCPVAVDGRCSTAEACVAAAATMTFSPAKGRHEDSAGEGGLATADVWVDGPLALRRAGCPTLCFGYVENGYDEGTDYLWEACPARTDKAGRDVCPGPTACNDARGVTLRHTPPRRR